MKRSFATLATLLCVLPAASHACNMDAYIGSVCTFAMDYCPQGFVAADGRLLQVNGNQALFSLLGNRYGGDGSTTFGVPDLRARAVVGTGQPQVQGFTAVNLGQKVGQQQVTLTAAQTPLPVHSHAATFTATMGTAPLTLPATTGSLQVTAALPVSPSAGTVGGTTAALGAGQNGYLAGLSGTTGVDPITFTGPYTANAPSGNAAYLPALVKVSGNPGMAQTTVQVNTVTGGTVAVQPASAGPTASVSTQSPVLGLTVCIATNGIYPTRQ